MTVNVPIRPATWYLQCIAMSTENGISFNEIPVRVSYIVFIIFLQNKE